MITIFKRFLICFLIMGLIACARMDVSVSELLVMPGSARIGVAPFANHSDTPLANRQAESMVVGLMHAKSFRNIVPYQRPRSCAKLLYCPDETLSKAQILSWARQHGVLFVIVGAANEWRYKVGLDGEPVAGVTLSVIQVSTGRTVWSGVGSAIGGSRSGLDVLAQNLIRRLLSGIQASC